MRHDDRFPATRYPRTHKHSVIIRGAEYLVNRSRDPQLKRTWALHRTSVSKIWNRLNEIGTLMVRSRYSRCESRSINIGKVIVGRRWLVEEWSFVSVPHGKSSNQCVYWISGCGKNNNSTETVMGGVNNVQCWISRDFVDFFIDSRDTKTIYH